MSRPEIRLAHRWRLSVPLGMAAVGLLAAACSSTTGAAPTATKTHSSQPSVASSTGAGTAVTVSAHASALGTVLADAQGRTLYVLTSDQPGHPACTGACLKIWPPVMAASSSVRGGSGVKAHLGVAALATGGQQVTVGGKPLYTFAGDAGAGQTKGQGIKSFGGTWYAVSTTGAMVTNSSSGAPSSPAPTSPSSPSAGY